MLDDYQDYSRFDAMETEKLEELLRQDFIGSQEDSDLEAVLYISELLARRRLGDKTEEEALRAWRSFQTDYLPGEEAVPAQEEKPGVRRLVRAALTAAVVCLLAGVIAVSAGGPKLWKTVAQWTGETFCLVPVEAESDFPPQVLAEMADCLDQCGISRDFLPAWLPAGIISAEARASHESAYSYAACLLHREGRNIVMDYVKYNTKPANGILYQKSKGDPECIQINGQVFYLMENAGDHLCVWAWKNMEFSISGLESREELVRILSSIPFFQPEE